jgi:hypothetical protein
MAKRPLALRFLWGHFHGGFLPLEPGRALLIGRKPGADLVIADDLVSRSHARLTFEGDDLVVEDLGSTNGTYLNGVRITRGRAVEGDRILVGGSIMKVVARDPVSQAADEVRADPGVATAAAEQRARAMQGHLEEVPLQDLLQLIAAARKTGVLAIERPGHEAEVEFEKGCLVRCVLDGRIDISAKKSFSRLLAWTQGDFELGRAPGRAGVPGSLAEPLAPLLADGMRQLEELRRVRAKLPTRFLAGAGPAADADDEDRALLALAVRHGSLEAVLDATPRSDLEAAQRLAALLDRGLLVGAE